MRRLDAKCAGRSGVAGLIATVVVLLLIVAAIGLARGWFRVDSTTSESTDRTDVRLTIDEAKMREDADDVSREARQVAQSVSTLADVHTVEGTITDIDTGAQQLTISLEEEGPLMVTTDEATEVHMKDAEGTLQGLSIGDRVAVTYREKDQRNHALKVSVTE